MKRLALLAIVLLSLPLSAQTFDCVGSGGTNCTALIPDPGVVTSTITIPAACGAVNQYAAGFTVDVDLTHTFVGDLTLTLTHPNGIATSTLVQRPLAGAGTCGSDDILGTFSDAGAAFQCAPTIPANGVATVLPVTPLSAFANLSPAGVWSLAVDDASASGAGALNNWGITAICGMPPTVTIVASDPTGNEAGNTITFTITRSTIVNSPVEPSVALPVTVTLSGTAANGVDYVAGFPVVIPAGAASTTLVITPLADALTEDPETVIATVQPAAGYVVGVPAVAQGVITDTTAVLPTVTIAASDATGDETGDTITFVITRSAITNSPVDPSLPLAVNVVFSGTALEGVDYVTSIPVVIPAGEASTLLVITPLSDDLVEDPETVIATVQPSADYVVGAPADASGVIEDATLIGVPTLSTWSLLLVSMLLAGAALFVLRGGSTS